MPSQPRPFTQDAAFTILFVLIATILVLVLSVSRRWSATDAALRQLDPRISAPRAALSPQKPRGRANLRLFRLTSRWRLGAS